MGKKPIIVIAEAENHPFYHALPLWEESVEIYHIDAPPHHFGPLQADLILIDSGFNDERGLRLLREVKLGHPEIPVMYVTDAGSEETAVAALRYGVRDYFNKPFELLEFRNKIFEFLEIKRAGFWGKRRHFLTDMLTTHVKASTRRNSDLPSNLLRSVRFIKENFARPISVDMMAEEGGVSKCHFCREFKKSTGMTPMQFLARIRIKRSKEYLRKKLPVSTIALKVGFNDLSSFNRNFRKYVGLTPTEFRASLRCDS